MLGSNRCEWGEIIRPPSLDPFDPMNDPWIGCNPQMAHLEKGKKNANLFVDFLVKLAVMNIYSVSFFVNVQFLFLLPLATVAKPKILSTLFYFLALLLRLSPSTDGFQMAISSWRSMVN